MVITDDMIERAAQAFYEGPDEREPSRLRPLWSRLSSASPDIAERYRRRMRLALEATIEGDDE